MKIYKNPVLKFRDAVINNQELQRSLRTVNSETQFLDIAAEHGFKCTIDDVTAAFSHLSAAGDDTLLSGINDGTLPLSGINDGTLPVLLNLLNSALNTVAKANDGTWPLKGKDNFRVFASWQVGNG